MPPGYSGRSLAQKLGIKKGSVLAFSNAPENYDRLLGKLPAGAVVAREPEARLDFIHLLPRRGRAWKESSPGWRHGSRGTG